MVKFKSILIKFVSFSILFLLTIGAAFYGCEKSPKYDVRFNGKVYYKKSLNIYEASDGNRITVSVSETDNKVTLSVQDDNVIIIIEDYQTFSITKDNLTITGNFDDEIDKNHILKDYIMLVYSYRDHVMVFDEYPEGLIFGFLSIWPFLFGLILLIDLFRKKERKQVILTWVFRSVLFLLFVSSLSLLYFVIYRHI